MSAQAVQALVQVREARGVEVEGTQVWGGKAFPEPLRTHSCHVVFIINVSHFCTPHHTLDRCCAPPDSLCP
jgi:hypothetical protein